MARKHIPLTIHKPGLAGLHKVNFVANADGQDNIIPFRYAFDDIENYTDLKSAGFFRHATKTVSSDLGGSSSEDTKTNLGFQLPPVEKLVLLCKVDTALTSRSLSSVPINTAFRTKKSKSPRIATPLISRFRRVIYSKSICMILVCF